MRAGQVFQQKIEDKTTFSNKKVGDEELGSVCYSH